MLLCNSIDLLTALCKIYFDSDCEKFFGPETLKPIINDDDVTCTTQFSKVVPLEGGEVSSDFCVIIDWQWVKK